MESYEREADSLSDRGTTKKLIKRIGEFWRCGSVVLVRSCTDCGGDRAGSGTFEGARTCKWRVCATCAWVRAKRTGEFFGRAFDVLEGPEGYRWQMFVVTIPYDPKDVEEVSVPGLRSRARRAARIGKELWKELKEPDAAFYRSTEVSVRGHVHLNCLYFGPTLNQAHLESVVQTPALDGGFVHIQDVDHAPAKKGERVKSDDPRGSREGLERAARYISKGLQQGDAHFNEDWLADDCFLTTIDPELAARWEVATYRQQLTQKYGALRGLKLDASGRDAKAHEDVDDSEKPCGSCGVVGQWRTVPRRAKDYIQACHTINYHALVRSRWKLRPRDAPD